MSLSINDRLKITTATMYNFADPAETKKRSPTQDDLNAICAAYPPEKAAGLTNDRTDLKKLTSRGGCELAHGATDKPIATPPSKKNITIAMTGS